MHRVDGGFAGRERTAGTPSPRYAAISRPSSRRRMRSNVPGQLEIVGYHQERGLQRTAQFQHQLLDTLGGMLVEVAGGLVEQYQLRTVDQRAGDRHPLALAAGQLGRLVRQAMPQPDPLQQLGRPLAGFRDRRAADQQRHADVLQGGELRQQVVKLVDEAQRAVAQQPAGRLVQRREFLAGEPDAAGGGRVQAAEHVQQGALARTGAADDSHPLPRQQVQLDAGQHLHRLRPLVVALAQVAATQHRLVIHNAKPPQAGCAPHARLDTKWRRS